MLLFEKHGLVELGVDYSAALTPNATGRPFWVTDGQVKVQSRQTYSGNQEREAQDFWSQPRRFFIPAFTCSLEDFLSLASTLLNHHTTTRPAGPLPARNPSPEDIRCGQFIVMAIEATRKDSSGRLISRLSYPPGRWVLLIGMDNDISPITACALLALFLVLSWALTGCSDLIEPGSLQCIHRWNIGASLKKRTPPVRPNRPSAAGARKGLSPTRETWPQSHCEVARTPLALYALPGR
jgi:hypothetical protein